MSYTSGPMNLIGGYEAGLVATGTVIGDALALTGAINIVATTAANTGVLLPNLKGPGAVIVVVNNGASTLKVYPPSATGAINAGSAGAAVSIATTKTGIFFPTGDGTYAFVLGA
jgi:hypothetical protein